MNDKKEIISKFEFVPVDSSQISTIAYSKEDKILAVVFTWNNAVYHYYKVPEEVYNNMLEAESVGRFLRKHIEGEYDYKKIS